MWRISGVGTSLPINRTMAKIGYIMVAPQYEHLEGDRKWMQDYGCTEIIEEDEAYENIRPQWKQLMTSLASGDELVVAKFSNALRGSRELAMFLEVCRIKAIRVISIHDRIDSRDELFPETKPSDVLEMLRALPKEVLVLRKATNHMIKLPQKRVTALPALVVASATKRLQREKTVINMYVTGYAIDDIWRASGFKSRSSVFRILNKHGIHLNRGKHVGPIKKWNERKNPIIIKRKKEK